MNVKSELQSINDTQAIEKLASIVNVSDYKKAFELSNILGGLESAVQKYVLSNIDKGNPAKSVIDFLAPAALFRLHKLLGALQVAAQAVFGISFTDILSTVVDQVKSILKQKGAVPKDDVINLGESMLVTSQKDPLEDLRKLAKSGYLNKLSQRTQPTGGYFLNPPKSTNPLHRVFGFLGKRKSQNLLVGIAIWLVKTILASAGLLLVGGAIAGGAGYAYQQLTDKDSQPITPSQNPNAVYVNDPKTGQPTQIQRPPPAQVPSTQPSKLRSSGAGTKYHKNNDQSIWVIPLNQSIEGTLINWAKEIYPQLRGNENIIQNTNSFNKMANLLGRYVSSSGYLVMPPDFHRRIDVVNTFIREVESKLPQATQEV